MSAVLKLLAIRKRRFMLQMEFDDLFLYSQFTEVSLIENSAWQRAGAIISDVNYPDRNTDEEIELYQNERRQFLESFPRALRISTLSLTHSTFETNMNEIARIAAIFGNVPIPANPLNIWPAKTFLEKKCSINCKSDDWELFKEYQCVRNAFIHNDGRIDRPLNSCRDLHAAVKLLGLEVSDFQINLTRACTAEFVLLCRRLCLLLLQRISPAS